MKMFGFKAIMGGNHTLISGHVVTKMGNGEFSCAFDHTDTEKFAHALRELTNTITRMEMVDRCSHRFELSYSDTDKNYVRCRMCDFVGPCFHQDTTLESGEWNAPGAVYRCLTCQYLFTYEGQGNSQTKVPYVRPTQPDVRTGEGSSIS